MPDLRTPARDACPVRLGAETKSRQICGNNAPAFACPQSCFVRPNLRSRGPGKLAQMAKRQTSIDALQLGMYIAELDRPWTETPFRFQGFYLRTGQQIEALRRYSRRVAVDVARSEPGSLRPAALRQAAAMPAMQSVPGFAIRGTAP